jgi:hypothetical protein
MNSDIVLRQEIRHSLDDVRIRIRSYTGLYSSENLTHDVLRACDEMTRHIAPDPRLEEARLVIEGRCRRLTEVADRFSNRDPAVIAKARAQAIAAIDMFQDAVLRSRRASVPVPYSCGFLRKRSL